MKGPFPPPPFVAKEDRGEAFSCPVLHCKHGKVQGDSKWPFSFLLSGLAKEDREEPCSCPTLCCKHGKAQQGGHHQQKPVSKVSDRVLGGGGWEKLGEEGGNLVERWIAHSRCEGASKVLG